MTQTEHSTPFFHRTAARLGVAVAALLCLGLLAASTSSASYEQVGNFAGTPGELQPTIIETGESKPEYPREFAERWPEDVQLSGTTGMAINYTGAGGVPKGTLYATTLFATNRVARFNPDGTFSENWTFQASLGGAPQERCGPDGDPTHPHCLSQPARAGWPDDVDVDQSTGNVYVINVNSSAKSDRIHVYTPDGSKLIAEFGEPADAGQSIAESPGKIHGVALRGSIAVDGEGHVYVRDSIGFSSVRLMEFEPQSPGDYEHYVYAGQNNDITLQGITYGPVVDAAGDIYAHTDSSILKLDPSQPADPPSCEFKFPVGGINAMTVDPLSGEVFFFSFNDKKIHVLSPCGGEGKFTEVGKFGFSPKRVEIGGLTFDPVREFAPGRPPGVLYAAAPDGGGGKQESKPPLEPSIVESSLGYIFSHPVEATPVVLSESVTNVTATTAELGAQINPKGPPTRYVFQYLTQAEYEANEASDRFAGAKESPPGGALLGEGPNPLSAGAALSGLSPDTTYHYRAVASSNCSSEDPEKVCVGTGADQAFHTFPAVAPGLPDNRAYELVSPVQKEGGLVFPADPALSSACPGGLGLCKPGGIGGVFPRQSTPDGEAIAYEGTAFSREEGAVRENEYVSRRDPKTGWQTTNPSPAKLSSRGEGFGYKAFDTGLSRSVIEQRSPALSPEAPAEYQDLYAQPLASPLSLSSLLSEPTPNRNPAFSFSLNYAGASADLSRVFFSANDVLSTETPFAPEAKDGGAGESNNNLYEWAEGQVRLVNVKPGNTETEAGATFGAASAQAISTDGSRVFWEDAAHQVYVRENAESTVELPDHTGRFLAASVDGSKVLLSDGALYDLGTETTIDLTEGKGGFQGVVGESRDLSHVYFVDFEVLTGEEENDQHAKAQAGKNNLYAWEAGGTARFVTTLSGQDNLGGGSAGVADWAVPSARTAEASPQGRYLAFSSVAPLSGYDNTGDVEAFVYDSATGKLDCASCNPTGLAPLGSSFLRRIRGASPAMPQPRYLSEEGRLFFDSRDSLTPFDTNEGVEDVYQYEPSGVGSCERAAGCVSLISAGSEPNDSNLLAVDETGRNVFFTTRDQLSLKDHDDLVDLYDARVDGGIPGETEVARGECQGEACVPQISPPNDPTPGSSTFEGAGNVDEKKAAKKHSKKHKKAHKKKHAKKHAHKRAAKNNRGGTK